MKPNSLLCLMCTLLMLAGFTATAQGTLRNRLHPGDGQPFGAISPYAFVSAEAYNPEDAQPAISLAPMVSDVGYSSRRPKPELSPCERIRLQRGNARVGFIAGAGVGLFLIGLGVQIAFEHLLSGGSEGAPETALGLILFTGSTVGYCVTIPKLSRRYHRCK